MEMVKHTVWHYHGSWFKIDLIVWKYSSFNMSIVYGTRFKIDLIVWKYAGVINSTPSLSSLK